MLVLESGDALRGDASAASEVDYVVNGLVGSTITQLADGQLSDTTAALYTSGAIVIVSSIVLVNTSTSNRTINLFVKPSAGTDRRIIPKSMMLYAGYSLMFDGAKFSVIDTNGQILITENILDNLKTISGSDTPYTALVTDRTILCDASGKALTVNLPAAANVNKQVFNIKKTDATANTITVDGNSTETIDGATTYVITTQYESITIQCDGSDWHII